MAAQVECVKDGRFYRPSNELAKKIALQLNVKTCNGANFKKVVDAKKFTTNYEIKSSKKLSVEEVIKGL